MTQDKNMFMTDQAVGAVMMALQKSLLEQSDIVPTLKNFNSILCTQNVGFRNSRRS